MDVLRKFGFEVYYGDITRLDLLKAAGAAEAELLIITIEDNYISMYQKHNADPEELVTHDLTTDMEELDRAWTAANPET